VVRDEARERLECVEGRKEKDGVYVDPRLADIIVCVMVLSFSWRDFVFAWEYNKSDAGYGGAARGEAGSVDETIDGAGDHECHC
jgi:hypothetical protein